MKKYIFLAIIVNITISLFGQTILIEESFFDTPEGECNPFKLNKYDRWRVSHGSPESDGGNSVVFSVNDNKSEGLFYGVDLYCGHTYDIIFSVKKYDGAGKGGLKVWSANGLKEIKDTTCELGYLPNGLPITEEIIFIPYNEINSHGGLNVSIEDWMPSTHFNRIWFFSNMEDDYSLDEVILDYVKVVDNGSIDVSPPTPPTNIRAEVDNNYPFLQNATVSWDASIDDFCNVKYKIKCWSPDSWGITEYSHEDSTYYTNYLFGNLTPCRTYYYEIYAFDASRNKSTTTYASFTTKPYMQKERVLDKDYTNKKRKVKEATDVIYLRPDFKFVANEDNEFFIARIGQCGNNKQLKKDSMNLDTTKNNINTYTNRPETKITITPHDDTDNQTLNNENIIFQKLSISPNPLTKSTTISYKLTEASNCQIEIYDLYGQLQKTLVNQNQTAGTHQTYANLSGLPAGVYMCVLKTNNGTTTQKIIKTN